MDDLTGLFRRLAVAAVKAVDRYCLYLKLVEPRKTKRVALALEVVTTVQILTLLIPIDKAEGLPWNYSNMGWLWYILHIVVRPDSIVLYLTGSHSTLMILWSTTLVFLFLTACFVAAPLLRLPDFQFENCLRDANKTRPGFKVGLHFGVRLLALEVLLIPLIFGTLRAIEGSPAANPNIETLKDHSPVFTLLYIVYLPFVVLHHTIESRLTWTDSYTSVSSPLISLTREIFLISLSLASAGLDYSRKPIIYTSVFLGIGAGYLLVIATKRPYFKFKMNFVCFVQGLVVVHASVCLFLTKFLAVNSPREGFTTVLFFVPVGLMVYLSATLMRWLEERDLAADKLTSSVMLEMKLKEEVKKHLRRSDDTYLLPSDKTKGFISEATLKYGQSPYVLISLLNFSMLTGDRLYLKQTLASLAKLPYSWLSTVHILYARRASLDWLLTFPEEAWSYSFISYKDRLKAVLTTDELTSSTTLAFYEELMNPKPTFKRLETLANQMKMQMWRCNRDYRSIIKLVETDPSLLMSLSGYLAAVENSHEAEKYATLAYKLSKKHGSLLDSKPSDLSYLDMTSCFISVSLDDQHVGKVNWMHNSDLLGYTQIELMDFNLTQLLPSDFAFDFRHQALQIDFNVCGTSVFIDKHGRLIEGLMKCALVNEADGKLAVLFIMKPNASQSVGVAFVSRLGKAITHCVSSYTD